MGEMAEYVKVRVKRFVNDMSISSSNGMTDRQ